MNSVLTTNTAETSCVTLPGKTLSPGEAKVWDSPEIEDLSWDAFLESVPQGQFQQSSAWGQYKQTQGWNVSRLILGINGRIAGGFQILWKSTRLGRIGYVSKGPVLNQEDPELVTLLARRLRHQAAKLGIQAVIAQPPDFSHRMAEALLREGFRQGQPLNIIEATSLLDLTPGTEPLEKRLNGSVRRNLRRAARAGVVVREGTGDEVSLFYDLMAATCARRGVTPNPPNRAATEALWQSMARHGKARLSFALCQGEVVAGKFSILFGNRYSSFKVGWNGRHSRSHPNELLEMEGLQWAQANGYLLADWVGISRAAAVAALEGRNLEEVGIRASDRFIMRFGGRPFLLPYPCVWIRNPVLRQCYRLAEPALVAVKSWRKHAASRSNA